MASDSGSHVNKCITLSSKNLLSVSSDEDYVDVQDSEFNDFGQSMTHPTAWSENSILTLSVEDHQKIELVEPKKDLSRKLISTSCRHLLLISTLASSLIILILSVSLLKILNKHEVRSSVWKTLQLLHYVGLYSFLGGMTTFISIEIVFSPFGKCLWISRLFQRKTEEARWKFQQMVLTVVFDDKFIRQYLKRAKNVSDTENAAEAVSFVRSLKCSDFIEEKCTQLLNSPEGLILDSLGIDCNEVRSYLKQTVVDLVFMVQENVKTTNYENNEYDPVTFKRNITNILTERLSNVYERDMNMLMRGTIQAYVDAVVAMVCVMMGVVGVIVGCITLFAL
ncbi:uncharacterized protein LOC130613717 [Hydractinia symbiolongicarpus]|uniref:uncharacterized protein LOC130613717 n=1 Tax=Hydractinia symbiolongicarpus TaxID=13093 RepID=UPI00254AC941|nr:uncharacterized protein LOC130613717 [Hydractinia symbiolongicarpus]